MRIKSRIPFRIMALLGAGLYALFGGIPAHAVDYVAELATAPSATHMSIGAGGLTWQCSGARCTASGQASRSHLESCRGLAQRVGRIKSFEIQAPPALPRFRMPAGELAECNKGVGPQFRVQPDLRPGIATPGASRPSGSKATQLPPARGKVPSERGVTNNSGSRKGDAQGARTVPLSLRGSGGLTEFRFDFSNGDHKIKSIGLIQSAGEVTATFSDNDGNDPFRFAARYRELPDGTQIKSTSSNNCAAVCDLLVENDPNGVFVLAGFEVRYHNDDRNILEFSVQPLPESGHVRVVFKDNGAQGFSARVQYAFIPRNLVRQLLTVDDNRIAGSEFDRRWVQEMSYGKRFLQAFEFRYTDGDHHLKKLGMDYLENHMALSFNDNNTDDPAYASVRYVILN